jgi:hypothetical protein
MRKCPTTTDAKLGTLPRTTIRTHPRKPEKKPRANDPVPGRCRFIRLMPRKAMAYTTVNRVWHAKSVRLSIHESHIVLYAMQERGAAGF